MIARKKERMYEIFSVLVLGIFTLIIFRKYLFGNYYYFMLDDSFKQLYANVYQLATEVWSGDFSLWNFSIGLGVDYSNYYTDPFNWIAIMFGTNHVAKGIVISECVKVFIIFVISYFFARKFCKKHLSALIFAVLAGSSGTTLVLGMYGSYTKITLCIMLTVLMFECGLKRKKWFPLVIPIVLTELSIGYYYLTLIIGILILYAIGRLYMENYSIREIGNYLLKIILWIVVGIIVLIPVLLPSLRSLFLSDRFLKSMSVAHSTSHIANREVLSSAFLRALSPDLEGISNNYTGAMGNYLDAPVFYVGLLFLLLLPQILLYVKGKKRVVFWGCILLSLVYIIFPKVTCLISGNANYTFKMSGMLVTFVLLFISLFALRNIVEQQRIDKYLLIDTYLVIQIALLVFYNRGKAMNGLLVTQVSLFLVGYILILLDYQKNNRMIVIFALVLLEVLVLTNGSVNNTQAMSKEEVLQDYYNDGTKEVVEYIKKNDTSKFYRMEKEYNSVGYCDSLVQGYYGTKSYVGGNNISSGYAYLLNTLGMSLSNNDSRWVLGFNGYPQVNSFFGVKYLISQKEQYGEFGYELKDRYNEKYIYENKYALPLGTVYNQFCNYSSFEKMKDFNQKRNAVLKYCITDDEEETYSGVKEEKNDNLIIKEYDNSMDQYGCINIEATKENETALCEVTLVCKERKNNPDLLSDKISSTVKNGSIGNIKFNNTKTGECLENRQISIEEGEIKYSFEATFKDMDQIRILIYEPELVSVKSVSCKVYNSEEYYSEYKKLCKERKQNGYIITEFEEDKIKGEVETDGGMLVLSVPYSEKWKCYIDGKQAEIKKVDYCLIE